MQYDKIHDRYNLPLGLHFTIKFNTVERPNKWITISNIPALDYFIYEGVETKEEILDLIQFIIDNFEAINYNLTENEAFVNLNGLTRIQINLFDCIVKRYNKI